MFPSIPYLKQEYLKVINNKIKKNKKLKNKELENDNNRLIRLKECMNDTLKNPKFSFKSGLYYSYLLKEYNKLKQKNIDTQPTILDDTGFQKIEIEDLFIQESEEIMRKDIGYWYDSFFTVFR